MSGFWAFPNVACYVTGQWCSKTDNFFQRISYIDVDGNI